jgi:hypothetical protein
LRTDQHQNLMVLGGRGASIGPEPENWSFYSNPGWYDDVSDGPVEAVIQFPDGTKVQTEPAWVIVAPPDFAPGVSGIVSLYDVLRQVGIDGFDLQVASEPSFTEDIYPLLHRAADLRWVNNAPQWRSISTDYAVLNDPTTAQGVRQEAAKIVRQPPLAEVKLRQFQVEFLTQWVAGLFKSDWSGAPVSTTTVTADGLTRAALEPCVGQGFFPGIEAGIIVENPSLYSTPFDFRFSHGNLSPGDITALMAQPWQADFLKCAGAWWPSQRPDIARGVAGAPDVSWADGVDSHMDMVHHVNKLGMIVPPNYDQQGRQPEPWTN